jgi:glycosyltransferase involved in cell wall biosynthesis
MIGGGLRLIASLARSYLGRKYYLFGIRVRLRAAFTRYDFCQAMDAMSLHAARGFARRGVPVLLDINEIPDPFERQGAHFIAAAPLVKRHLAAAFARDLPAATRIVATSAAMADFVAERFGRTAVAIRNARAPLAAPSSSAIRADAGGEPGTRVIVYPCTAAPHLGVEAAIATMSRLSDDYRLVFVGRFATPAYRQEIERLIRFRGLRRRVVLKGEVRDADYLAYLAGADLGLVPLSFAYRNQRVVLPWRVIDLAAAGVPMVATASDEIQRLARHYDLGEIAARAEPDDLADAVQKLAATSADRIAAIKRDLRALAENFSPAREQARYRAVIGELAQQRAGRAAFVVNLALRHNRRLVAFIDQVCALGWRVDLYCVRAPSRDLFAQPDRVRFIERSDRLAPRYLRYLWPMLRRVNLAIPGFRSVAGIGFGLILLGRALRFARAVRREAARRGPWDIVIASDVFALPASLVARRSGGELIYDATEIPDLRQRTAPALRRIPLPLRLSFRLAERIAVRRAGLILTTGAALARYLRARYRGRGRVVPIRAVASVNRVSVLAGNAAHPLRDRLGIPDSDIVIVSPCGISPETGGVVAAQMLRFLPPDHVLVFIGRFSHRRAEAAIKAVLSRERTAHRCFFVGEVAYPTYLRYLADGDLGLALFDTAIANMRLAAPNRVFDLMAMGVPIVATAIEEVVPLIARSGIGAVVRERRPAAAARAVTELRARLGIAAGGTIDRRARAGLDRIARLQRAEREQARLIAALTAQGGELRGKRVALLTLRSAFSNHRFRRIGAALIEAGAAVDAFDTDIGLAPSAAEPLSWLTTIAIR